MYINNIVLYNTLTYLYLISRRTHEIKLRLAISQVGVISYIDYLIQKCYVRYFLMASAIFSPRSHGMFEGCKVIQYNEELQRIEKIEADIVGRYLIEVITDSIIGDVSVDTLQIFVNVVSLDGSNDRLRFRTLDILAVQQSGIK